MSDKTTSSGNDRRSSWLTAGGILGAVLASSCCILPLMLISAGVSGAWIGQLTVLEPYKPAFMLIAAGFLAAGFWEVYFRKGRHCEDGSYCARPASSRIKQIALWGGAFIVVAALTIDTWAPLFY
ncbi:MAG: mercury transporter MerT [Hyphomonas sp.]|uniref:mercuric transporter MerT family protein n=1 Tax=Hyphomonas sp. TaxID=87 RepID=UPI00178FB202|nr:mercuric transporter MerT family protein [Hyphomonas sp.]MBA3069848.1 mercury transporter MerT [Hyphomonas sp.]MBU3919943.1 mercury transporter MerT [Alphaproteobacteria bacterium]MBU4063550.1 mercury transporter MerT [Alphaproteobacteria bacterium]MBU4162775.1 mercury transporter MerT [Alphaproteobacteria bacterium]